MDKLGNEDKAHHYQSMLTAWILLILSRHSSLSVISLDCIQCPQELMNVSLCWLAKLVCLCIGDHRRTLLMNPSIPYLQWPTCLACMVFKMGGKWPYNCFVGCCIQDLIKTACSIIMLFPSSFFSIRVQVV